MKISININIKKEMILYFSICFIIFISFLTIKAYVESASDISLEYPEQLREELNNYKDEVELYKDSTCKSFVKDFIEQIDNDTLNGEYPPETVYIFASASDFLSNYKNGNESCNIDENSKKSIVAHYLSIMNNSYSVIRPYFFQYELGFHEKGLKEMNGEYSDLAYTTFENSKMALLRLYMDYLREESNNE